MRRALAASFLLLAAAGARAGSDLSLVPEDGTPAGFRRAEAPKVFAGAELYGHIDGGAEIFLELGFDALTLARFRRGDAEIVLEIYRMDDPVAAWGIYLAKCGKETPDPGFSERHTFGRYQLAFVKGRYYVLVNNDAGTPEVSAGLLEIGRFTASRIPGAERPAALALLLGDGLVPSTVRLIRGRYGLQSVAGALGEGDLLLLGGKAAAVAGEYRQPGGGTRTLLLVDYPSAAAATAAFSNVREKLDPLLKVLSADEVRILFQDRAGKFGSVSREGARVRVELDLVAKPTP
ncbi:MAG: hypothetical protein LAO51_13855 [Acidobacteriia bacterium]|nr:hypothetical protein [Terriglobia bacterium]